MKFSLGAPEPLAVTHVLDDFSCGEPSLDAWLQRRALSNHLSGASRTFVVADERGRVYGYYALAAGAVEHQLATGSVRRNMPDPIPALVLARLAVDKRAQGIYLGAALLNDAADRAALVAEHAGVRAFLVHAISEEAKKFYLRYGFKESPIQPMTLMIPINKLLN